MAAISPIPTGRTSDLLVQTRLLSQLQSDQLALLKLQDQLSTGRRISAPSEDAPAALRGIGLQRLIEQKDQARINLDTSKSYLTATDSAISNVAQLLAEVRGTALSVADSTTGSTGRQAASQEISQALTQLIDVGNQRFRGRYLFAGTRTTIQPFEVEKEFVIFKGNESNLQSFADIDLLFETNLLGNEVFGAISPEVKGTADLNPVLNSQTRLSDLQGGLGIREGSLVVSDGASSVTIDTTGAETLGDVAKLLEANPPTGRTIRARITATGLNVEVDSAGGGNLTIRELGNGTTAAELGILDAIGNGTNPIIGNDLDPKLRLTTLLSDILGVRANAFLSSAGVNNDLIIEAVQRGTATNGIAIQFVDDNLLQASPGLAAGSEVVNLSTPAVAARASLSLTGGNNDLILTAATTGTSLNNVSIVIASGSNIGDAANTSYDAVNKIFTINIDDTDETTLGTLVAAINGSPQFNAAADPSAGEGFNAGSFVLSADAGVVSGNTGNSGGAANTVFVNINSANSTANNIVTAIQANGPVSALLTVRLDDKDSTNTNDAGTGVVGTATTAITAGGSGVAFDQSSGLQVINGNETFTINFQGAQTVEDLLNTLNGSKANLLAEINEKGNGINIRSRLSGSDFHIGENGGTTATALGVRTFTTNTSLSDLKHGFGVHTTEGTDFIIRRNDGVELQIDVSTAQTIGDVLNLINNHVNNSDPTTAVVAQLKATGNGIELVDDNPLGTGTLTVIKENLSEAVWDLGLVPTGQAEARPTTAPPPTAATAIVAFAAPNDQNNRFTITANSAGTPLNGVQILFTNGAAVGNQALVAYDGVAKTLTIDVNPAATTTNTVINAIIAEGTFAAAIDQSVDPTNDGTGLVVQTGLLAVTSGGTPNPTATEASAAVTFPPPFNLNTALLVTSNQPGTGMNGVNIEFQNTLFGDVSTAVYDPIGNRLLISVDTTATTATTVANAILADGTFRATLDTSADPTNNGTGIIGATGVLATTSGGLPEVLAGIDTNPLETKGIFNSLTRLNDALLNFDILQVQRAIEMLDDDFNRVTFARAGLGAREQSLDTLQFRLDDETIELKSLLSTEIDTDLIEAISALTARQASFQASLQLIGRTAELTLLNFL